MTGSGNNSEKNSEQSDDVLAQLTRRGLLGTAALAGLSGMAAGQGNGGSAGGKGGAVYNWKQDVDAQGNALANLGALDMAATDHAISRFDGDRLGVDGDGVLNVDPAWEDTDGDGLLEALEKKGIEVDQIDAGDIETHDISTQEGLVLSAQAPDNQFRLAADANGDLLVGEEGSLFLDGFEDGFDNWTTIKGTPETDDLAHTGGKSFRNQKNVYIAHDFEEPRTGVIRAWLYDDPVSGAAAAEISVRPDTGASFFDDKILGVLVLGGQDEDNYVVRAEGNIQSTNVERTKGWHKVEFDYTGSEVTISIDDQQVYSGWSVEKFQTIILGDRFSDPERLRYDDIAVCDYVLPSTGATGSSGGSSGGNFVNYLPAGLSEKEVRNRIESAGNGGSLFVIDPAASWTLTDTLNISPRTTLISSNNKDRSQSTFVKGFNGPLAEVEDFCTLVGITFDGNQDEGFGGHGLVTPRNTREVYMEKVFSNNNAGSGYVTRTYYQTYHLLCGFDGNGEWGIECKKHHHTNNIWDSCHIGDNGKGGVLFANVDKNTVFTNSIIIRNGGPGVKNELPDDYSKGNNGIRQVTFKDSVFIENDGPAFLNKDVVVSWGIVFEDCRVKKNGQNPSSGLTNPIGGVVHLEDSATHVELRGLEEWENGTNGETCYHATGNIPSGARTDYNNLLVSGAVVDETEGTGVGDIEGPETKLTVANNATVQGSVNVKSGVGLDPDDGVVRF